VTAEVLLDRLERVRSTARGWTSLCPSHPDKSPSLSIRNGGDDRILLHCFAGCTAAEICTAIGVRLSDLFPNSARTALSPREAARVQWHRQAIRLMEDKRHEARGSGLDLVREAALMVRSASGIDIAVWTAEMINEALNGPSGLADAYEILHRDGVLYEPF
jgi:hypothetical protein